MSNPTSDLIRVFDRDPDLLAGVEEPATTHPRTRMTARHVWVERGRRDARPCVGAITNMTRRSCWIA